VTTKSSAARALQGLAQAGLLPAVTPSLEQVAAQFAVAITPAMQALIDPDDPADPIAAQFVPSEQELRIQPGERADPIGDEAHSPLPGIVHRYPDRILLKLLHACPVYCRFCFRREQIGAHGEVLVPPALEQALAYIAAHKEIWEVILTGGDPLMLSDRRLADVIAGLNQIDHVKILRIHTRIPVVDPARVTPELIAALRGNLPSEAPVLTGAKEGKPVYVLLHCNHPRELTEAARAACARLVDAGFPMLSQSVLLRGVNDDAQTLGALMRALVESRVKPHYLHQLDQARGTGHFRVPLKRAQELVKSLRGYLSGLCQPTLMLDIPGGHGKVPVGPVFARTNDEDWIVEDHRGRLHEYKDGL